MNKALELADKLEKRELEAMEYGFDEDLLSAVAMLRSQEKYINLLHKLCNANGIGSGRDLLTGAIIPFEVEE